MKKELFIKNRLNQKINVLVENIGADKLAFIVHGVAGNVIEEDIRQISKTLQNNGFCVVSFDAVNASGKSDGDMQFATFSGYYNDLIDVIAWGCSQDFYKEKFLLVGHSMGAMLVMKYNSENSKKINGLCIYNPSTGAENLSNYKPWREVKWEEVGFVEWDSTSTPGKKKRLNWSLVEDLRKYNIDDYLIINKPLLQISGRLDEVVRYEAQKKLFEKIVSSDKMLETLEDGKHNFRGKNLDFLNKKLDNFLKKYFN
ncbi:MAG: lysophospholipase [Candidatus Gracilibacteria bacterium]|nr:lysophospholipase [Candidatus Gracilibacteria bacterium]